ncbi:pygopus homolog 1 [Latimeria chalumnae]|uniref:Pygopus family PHD finger 1 n=1 Tax=Latimeria chalumnae TaxID=7897 RepID=H3B560_LATCH|nr:PREDICTED: pygopus homolog 1 [Latimeria chalumnae]|eukprot:XP_005996226.1 PREDICTED: pygopus homolog 1 [Latimeria chalumnae]
MSAEQEKESTSLKRIRGSDGGLEDFGGPVIQLGSLDKKKRKSSTQASSFSPLSEYAPPSNPSVDHLVAANPFDDSYSISSYKLFPSGNPYFSNPSYLGFETYNTFRMPPRMTSPFGSPYSMRNQPRPFPQNPVGMGYNRPYHFNFGSHDHSNFGSQPVYNGMNQMMPPNQIFRPNPNENFSQMSPQNVNQHSNPDIVPMIGPANNLNITAQVCANIEPNQPFVEPQNNYNLRNVPPSKQDFSQGINKNVPQNSSTQHHQNSEESVNQGNTELKNVNKSKAVYQNHNRSNNNSENVNGNHANVAQNNSHQSRGTTDIHSPEKSSKTCTTQCLPGQSSSDLIYPCGICMNEVNDDQDAILCEASCQKWFHRVCTGMTEAAYTLLTAEASAVWGCDTCMSNKDVQLMRTKEHVGQPTLINDA